MSEYLDESTSPKQTEPRYELRRKGFLAVRVRVDPVATPGAPWLLTLQHFYPNEGHFASVGKVHGTDEIMRWNEQGPLWGSQGYMMSSAVATKIADTFDRNLKVQGPERLWGMMDEGIWRMCVKDKLFEVYSPNPA